MPIPLRRFLGPSILVALSVGLAVAFILLWPKPISVVLAGVAELCATATMLLLYIGARARGSRIVLVKKAIFLPLGFFGLVFLALAWRYSKSSPAFSSASLISAGLIGLGAVAALFFTRLNEFRS